MDLPAPLTAAQKQELRVEHRSMTRIKANAEREIARLAQRLAALQSRKDRIVADIRVIDDGAVVTEAAQQVASVPSNADATDASIPAWKRRRDAAAAAASAPVPQQPSADDSAAPTASGPVPPRRAVQRGAAFGLLQGVLQSALKEQADSRGLDAQRLAAQRKVQRVELAASLALIEEELAQAQRECDRHSQTVADVVADLELLTSVVDRMDDAEDEYCDSFFLKAEGACYSIPFQPLVHTEASRMALDDQIMVTAKDYVTGFRAAVDEAFRALHARRARHQTGAAVSNEGILQP